MGEKKASTRSLVAMKQWCGFLESERGVGVAIGGIGLILASIHGYHIVAHEKSILATVVGAVVPLIISLTLVWAGYWTINSGHQLKYLTGILHWTVLGGGAMGLLIGTIGAHQYLAGQLPVDAGFQLATAITGGTIGGFALGIYNVQAQRRADRFESLQESTKHLVDATEKKEVLEQMTRITAAELDLALTGAWLYDDSMDALEPVATTPEARETFGDHPTFERGEGLAWTSFSADEELVVSDVHEHEECYNPETEVRSEIVLPLGDHGVFIAGSTSSDGFDEIDVATTRLLAPTVTAVLDRVERERELHENRRKLEEQNEHLDEFASIVSHDLRNPLNVAQGQLTIVREDVTHPALSEIEFAHSRMSDLIDEMLSLARAGRNVDETTEVRLDEVAADAWRMVETESATLELPSDQLTVRASKSRVHQLFENLFRNVVDHAGPDATVRVGSLEARDGFYVQDNGPGIPLEKRECIFDRGYTTQEDGSGLGLQIVQRVASAHQWSITVTEGVTGGARFEFETDE